MVGHCRSCRAGLRDLLIDLGHVRVAICPECLLGQLVGEVPTATSHGHSRASSTVRSHLAEWAEEVGDALMVIHELAHTPDFNDAVASIAARVDPGGVVSIEFHHLLRLVQDGQFDIVSPGHSCYLSLTALSAALERHGLSVFAAREVPMYGGSVRVQASPHPREVDPAVGRIMSAERTLASPATAEEFRARAETVRGDLLGFLAESRSIVGYGAPERGDTLLTYCGIGPDVLPYTVDIDPAKQGGVLPGSGVPVFPPERIREDRPDVVLILPWYLADEIAAQMADVRAWGGRFAVALPELRVF